MSHRLISLNSCLRRLIEEGYEIEIRSNHLLVHSVPYVNAKGEVAFGILVSELTQKTPDVLDAPGTHQIHFVGEHPCHADGSKMVQIANASGEYKLLDDLIAQHYFSHKREAADRREGRSYTDYHEKVVTYVSVISSPAKAIDAKADARTFRTIEPIDEESVFLYEDTASSRAGIQVLASRFKKMRIAIVGLGGTGAYVLELVSKTHVLEIHLYDGDWFRPHNAFRTPGAASRAVLDRQMKKVDYLAEVYGGMRKGIVPHDLMISEENVEELASYDFVFICVDKGTVRQLIVNALVDKPTPFIDVGMGVNLTDDHEHLWGTVRVTTSTPDTRELAAASIPKVNRDDEIYGSNIQVAELNCLNATLAVIKWKRLVGFYQSDKSEHESTFNTAINRLNNKEPEK